MTVGEWIESYLHNKEEREMKIVFNKSIREIKWNWNAQKGSLRLRVCSYESAEFPQVFKNLYYWLHVN